MFSGVISLVSKRLKNGFRRIGGGTSLYMVRGQGGWRMGFGVVFRGGGRL